MTSFGGKKTVKEIAKEHNLSCGTVERLLDRISVTGKAELPVVLGMIDKFKGDTDGEKYQKILTDVQHNEVKEILPTRYKKDLTEYFLRYSIEERKKVRVIVMDMWEDYRALAWMFPNAKIVANKYHWARQINRAVEMDVT